ncbi:MAG: DUF3750 domain-containing protein [Gammaproteobacteria bacterium]|nr:DUF3750 domain-containing protein [Gammaproteobacteria bacterium]
MSWIPHPKWRWFGWALLFIFVAPGLVSCVSMAMNNDRRNDSAGIAPDPQFTQAAVLQVYAAGVYGWRGLVADHTWVAAKPSGASDYTVYQVIGWLERRGLPVVSIKPGVPDRHWWGSKPRLLLNLQGPGVDELIDRVDAAARTYPYANEYVMWPGPNSNSFTAWIGLEVEELNLELPWRAIGKGWMEDNYAME